MHNYRFTFKIQDILFDRTIWFEIMQRKKEKRFCLFAFVFNIGLQLIGVSSDNTMNFFAIFKKDKCWHSFNIKFLWQSFRLIDVTFKKNNCIFKIPSAPLFDFWSYTNTWTTPTIEEENSFENKNKRRNLRGKKIDDN